MTVLFSHQNANGSNAATHDCDGSMVTFAVTGTFNGGTVKFQCRSRDDENAIYIDIPDAEFSGDGVGSANYMPNGYEIRAFMTGSGGGTDVWAEAR